jgi:hypothetical protein
VANYDLSNSFKRQQFLAEVKKFVSAEDYVTLQRIAKPRSSNQNRYLHALLGLLCTYTGYTINEMKDTCKVWFAPRYFREPKTKHEVRVEFIRHTSEMTKEEMTDFIDKIRHWGNSNGYYLPTVEEWQTNWREIDEQINQFRGR